VREAGHPPGGAGQPAPQRRLIELVQGHWASQVVATVARLGIPDLLAVRARSSAELAGATAANPDALRRLLRAAATIGLLDEGEPDCFSLTPVGAQLRSCDGCLRNFAIALAAPGLYRPMGLLYDSVVTGRPMVEEALGSTIWEYYDRNPAEGAHFAMAMRDVSAVQAAHVVGAYPFDGHRRIVDVGGGHGVLLAAALRRAPAAAGALLELPEVVEEAREVLGAADLAGRVELVAGDFFGAVPGGGDLYVLKHVLHDWEDDRAARILACCRRAAAAGSTLLIVETLLPEGVERSRVHLLDINMLVIGGRARGRDQFDVLLRAAGYRLERIIPTPVGESVVEARAV
jgi:hypothetical protein